MERWPLPEGWEWRRLGDSSICTIIMGQSPPSSTYNKTGQGLPFFQGKADFGDIHPQARTWCIQPARIAQRGDVLISVRAPVGPSNIASETCGVGRGLAILRPSAQLDSKYLWYAVRVLEEDIASRGSGSTFEGIGKSALSEVEIPLPHPDDPARSLETQRRIVARLDALLAEVAAARRLHAEIVADTARVMEAVRDEVFSELAHRAPKVQFSQIADSRLGKMLSQASKSGVHSRPYLRNANVLWDEFKLDDVYEMDFLPEEREEFLLKPGDLLICEGGEIGRCAVWDGQIEECYFQKALHRARLKEPHSSPRYLMHFMAWAAENGAIAKLRTGSAIPHLTGVRLKTLEVIWPEPMVQHQVVTTLDQVKTEITQMQANQSENSALLNQAEQAILAQAFRGEL